MIKLILNRFFVLLLILNISWIYAQDFDKLSNEICESLTKTDSVLTSKYEEALNKFFLKDADKEEFSISDFNKFSFNIQHKLIENCNFFSSSKYSFYPLSNIADLENLFNYEETKQLEKQLLNIKYNSRFEVFIISTNDYYPRSTIKDYSFSILNFNSHEYFEKGSLIIVINTKERELRISTNETLRKLISDDFCNDLIQRVLVPNFKSNKFYLGIEKILAELEQKVK